MHFKLALAVSDTLTFPMYDLENVGQGHREQHAQCRNSVVNTDSYTGHRQNLYAISHGFGDINVLNG